MSFTAPQYIPGETDITLLLGRDSFEFEANRNILASQSKFFEKACYNEEFKEAKERLIKLPDIQLDTMMEVLAWLYRSEPKLPEDFTCNESTCRTLAVLSAADFLQIDTLAKDYGTSFGKKLELIGQDSETKELLNCVKVMNGIYKARGSIQEEELFEWVKRIGTSGRQRLMSACSLVEAPNGTFFQDLSCVILKAWR
ncbi:hypothetical protein TWF173_001180 [Orbilia oligospora]|uniref:BTB domain-containing protein n=1 Tax=Arthrobotrys oligospora (strain ATCC 24927 / CBS 115.81 / DSM 1491) TaxID=756982 RepID=G1XF62_ARTOA|nr:hypothetical protein AOL_s00081g3 [Orbilia oligospora ATCC 24927]EGX48140.1 hypothetical protein AOL_s00081g3 [Orbilia oligospora ATCC 24927]KAF3308479.1 hypothetical protein TWF173_001180 [Orbilia oligospora]